MKCSSCGYENPENAEHCGLCSNVLKKKESIISNQEILIDKTIGSLSQSQSESKKNSIFRNLKWYEMIAVGWPLILLAGGAIGGACGGLACALNGKLFSSKLSNINKYIFSFLIGIGAIIIYFVLIAILVSIFPGLAKK